MKLSAFHDLKTERNDVGQPLPAALRLLPVLFYAGILGAIGFSSYAFLQMKAAQMKTGEAKTAAAREQSEGAKLKADESSIMAEDKNAREVQRWIVGTNQMQAVALGILRTIDTDASVSDMILTRREEQPSQIELSLTMNSPKGPRQVEAIRTKLQDVLGYRTFSENIDKGNDKTNSFNFNCVLVKTDAEASVP